MDREPTTAPQKSTPTAGELDGAVLESLQFKLIWKHMWKVFWGNWIAILGLSILTGIVAAIPQGPIQILTIQAKKDPMSAGLVIFILSVISTLLRVQIENGWIRYRLVLVRGQAVLLRVFYEDIMRVFFDACCGGGVWHRSCSWIHSVYCARSDLVNKIPLHHHAHRRSENWNWRSI